MGFGRDLALQVVDGPDGRVFDLAPAESSDLATVEGDGCAAQSLMFRLAVRRGELAPLGHPDFGSLLEGLVGEPLDSRTLRAAEALVREALAGERRVSEVLATVARPVPGGDGAVEMTVDLVLDDGRRMRAAWSEPLGR